MYICYCPLRDPNWNKNIVLYCIVLYSNHGNTHEYAYNIGVEMTDHKYVLLILWPFMTQVLVWILGYNLNFCMDSSGKYCVLLYLWSFISWFQHLLVIGLSNVTILSALTRDIHFRNGHMQNLNFLQFRYFVIYFVIFVSMDWETESVMIVIM